MTRTRILAMVGVLTGLAFILYFLEVPTVFLFPAAPYLKIDFSDVPAVLGAIAAGPIAGVAIAFLKNVLHFLLISKEPMASGEIGNFFAGIGFIIPVAVMLRKSEKFSILPYIVGTISAALLISVVNYFITLPLYGIGDSGVKLNLLIYTFAPFNLLKGVLVSIVTIFLHRSLKNTIKKLR